MRTLTLIIIFAAVLGMKITHFDKEYGNMPLRDVDMALRKEAFDSNLKGIGAPKAACSIFRRGFLAELDQFSDAVKKYQASHGILRTLKELFVSEDLKPLRLVQQKAQRELVMLDSDVGAQERIDNPRTYDPDVSLDSLNSSMMNSLLRSSSSILFQPGWENTIPAKERAVIPPAYQFLTEFSLINRITNWQLEVKEVDRFALEIDRVDAVRLGRFFGKLGIWGDFACFTVPDLSLIIFKMFYLRILHVTQVADFFGGFFGALETAGALEGKDSHAHKVFNRFFGFNLLVILGIDNNMAERLFKMFDARSKDNKTDLKNNFVELYVLVLETITKYEDQTDRRKIRMIQNLARLDRDALKIVAGQGTFLALVYTLSFMKSLALGNLDAALSTVISQHTNFITEAIEGAIKQYIPSNASSDAKVREMLALEIKGRVENFNAENLADFQGYFEKTVAAQKSCTMCRVNEELENRHDHYRNRLII